ncbi:hypothetical protein A2V82_08970 [candidate division KSB1 bacterium RBG_16_48_16]|nr:MAG: hypothetical protein A2V82_08970 [candidate division KSB1 bacterium RBG_16_48_16]
MGYLATDNFRQWLTDDGGHRCVLNLPDLTPEEIEQFCEKAFRRFHFRPKYILYKIGQAIRHPREGWRSIVAGFYFIFYLLSNKRKKQKPFHVERIPIPDGWTSGIKVPMGRMEQIKRGIPVQTPE